MRLIVGLDRADAGTVTVGGRPFAEHAAPLTEVGALLDAQAVHPGRTAEGHLSLLAATHGIGRRRVEEVMDLTGISSVARRRVGGFSLGMRQRLGIAATLLGDPHTLLLDEPVNGLDPEGVHWVRGFVRTLAAEGRTVFLSSHLMSEMAQTADHVIVLGRGRVLADAPTADLVDGGARDRVRVRSSDPARLAGLLAGDDVAVTPSGGDALDVAGLAAADIARVAVGAGLDLHEVSPVRGSLEDAYLALTGDAVEYRSDPTAVQTRPEGIRR